MTDILNVPIEILLHIVNLAGPKPHLHLSQTCRTLWSLLSSTVPLRLDVTRAQQWQWPDNFDEKALLVQDLVAGWPAQNTWKNKDQGLHLPKDNKDILKAVRASQHGSSKARESLLARRDQTLMHTLTPNLRSLVYHFYIGMKARSSYDEIFLECFTFSHLRHVRLYRPNVTHLETIFRLPTLHSLYLDSLIVGNEFDISPQLSNLKILQFKNSAVAARTWPTLLQVFKKLEMFSYDHEPRIGVENSPLIIVGALCDFQKDLIALRLRNGYDTNISGIARPLTELPKLEYLSCGWQEMYQLNGLTRNDDNDDDQDDPPFFPDSLKCWYFVNDQFTHSRLKVLKKSSVRKMRLYYADERLSTLVRSMGIELEVMTLQIPAERAWESRPYMAPNADGIWEFTFS